MKTVAVIFGGQSTEHDVSIITALSSVIKPLELTREYTVIPVYIAKDGSWYSDDKLKDISLFTSGNIDAFIARAKPLSVELGGGLHLVWSGGLGKTKRTRIDIAFPAMHGTFGEDGSLMGLLDMAGIPYVGCGMPASVLAMDKVLAKQVTAAQGIAITKFEHFTRAQVASDLAAVARTCQKSLRFPVFVKPAHLGSSIGITRASNQQELENALEVAAHYDDKVLVEEAVQNLVEVTLPVMGNQELSPALLERPLAAGEEFFDFETKYMRGGKKGSKKAGGTKGAHGYSELPAALSEKLYQKAESTGLSVYRALGCSGTARIDMLIDSKTEAVYFNEVNPLPGSLYAHNWRVAGVAGVDLVRRLITLAEERHASRQELSTKFSTSFLKQF